MLKFPDTLLQSDDVVVKANLTLHKISGWGGASLDVRRVRCTWSRKSVTYTSFMNRGTERCSLASDAFPSGDNIMVETPLNPQILNHGRARESAFCFKVMGGPNGGAALISSEKARNQDYVPTLQLIVLREPRKLNTTLPPSEDKETEKDVKAVNKVRMRKRKSIYKRTTRDMLDRKRRTIPGALVLSKAEMNERDDRAKRRERLEMAIFMYERYTKRNKLMAKRKVALVQNKTETQKAAAAAASGFAGVGSKARMSKVDSKWGNFSEGADLIASQALEKAAKKIYIHGHYMPVRAVLKTMPHLAKVGAKIGAQMSIPADGSPTRQPGGVEELGEQHGHLLEAEAVAEAVRKATGSPAYEGQRVAMKKPSENDVASLSADDAATVSRIRDTTAENAVELIQLEDTTLENGLEDSVADGPRHS